MIKKTGSEVFIDLTTACVFMTLVFFFIGCKNYNRNNSHPEITDADISKGRALASRYCQGCHELPDPSLLDSKHWEQTELPYMGPSFRDIQSQF